MNIASCAAGPRRAVVLAVGSWGDVAPLAGVAAQLAARGLDTTLMAPQRYAAQTPAGVRFASAGAEDVFEQVFSGARLWTARHGLAESWRYYGPAALHALTVLQQNWSPQDTVLVSSSFAVGARLAEDALGYRNTTVHLSPGVLFSHMRPPRWPAMSIPPNWPGWLQAGAAALAERLAIDPVIQRALAPALRAARLPITPWMFSRFMHSPRQVAYGFPAWFAPAAADWPACGRHMGFFDAPAMSLALSPPVRDFLAASTAPLAVITAGTAVAARPPWLERVLTALLDAGMRALVLAPAGQHAPAPRHARLCFSAFEPLPALLAHAHVLVHHGGIGTAAAGLRVGVAQWCFPTAHDQADNSFRLTQLGVGETFSARAAPARLRQAAQQALDGRWAPACAQWRAKMAMQPDALAALADWAAR